MKYNTGFNGRSSHQIGADEKHQYYRSLHRGEPSHAQKAYLKYLMASAKEVNVDISKALGKQMINSKYEYSVAIGKMKRALRDAGFQFSDQEKERDAKTLAEQRKRHEEYRKKRDSINWISMKDRKPDRHFVETIDDRGKMVTLEWNGKCFLDNWGKPITKESERLARHLRVPVAWAYLGGEGRKK